MTIGERIRAIGALVTGKAAGETVASFMRGGDVGAGPATRLDRPYVQSAWVRSAVRHISGEIAGRPLKFYRGEQEYEESSLAGWWSAPALGPQVRIGPRPLLSISSVQRDLSSWISLEGEFFILIDDSWLVTAGRPAPAARTPFLIGRPDRMRLIIAGGELQGYDYVLPGGRRLTLLPEQVIHYKEFNPYDDWRGMGALQAASIAAESAFSTGVYVRDLMRNNGDQGFIVVGKNGVATPEQREQIAMDLRAKRAALRRGVAMDLFLTGDITVERPPERSASTDLNVGKGMSHQEVYVAFGVPPSMAEVKASYSIGKESDRYQLISGTCQPMGNEIASALAMVASMQTGLSLTAELDWDDHPVMIEVRASRIQSAQQLWGMGMPMREANDYLGLGMKPFSGWDVGYLPFSVAAIGGDTSPAPTPPSEADPALAEPVDEDPAVAQLRLVLLARQRACKRVEPKVATPAEPDFSAFHCTCHSEQGSMMKGRSEKEVRLWKSHMGKRVETMKAFESGIRRELMQARAATLAKISRILGKAVTKAAAADLIFDLDTFSEGMVATMRKRAKTALDSAGKQLFSELGKDDPWSFPPAKALSFLRERENRFKDASEQIHSSVKASLEDGLNAGDTMEQLSARVRTAFNGISDGRARTIAATETAVCYGVARDQAMQDAGVPFKQWLTSGNSNVRQAHADANGQSVALDEPFIVDGEQLMHPGDPSGSAGNVINCHCVSIAKSE